jgi:hypothetical protein
MMRNKNKCSGVQGNAYDRVKLLSCDMRSVILSIFLFLLLVLPSASASSATPAIAWNKTFDDSGSEVGKCIIAIADGYVITGFSNSYGHGGIDVYLLKTDMEGNRVWNRTYGGGGDDMGYSVVAVGDGYVITGYTTSFNVDMNVYLVKTDTNGTMIWQKTYGGADWCMGYSVTPVADGYVIAGLIAPYGQSDRNIYLVKTDTNGTMLWNRTYDGTANYEAFSLMAVSDGFVISGNTGPLRNRNKNIYLMKTDTNGTMLWNEVLNDPENPYGYTAIAVSDGYVISGSVFLNNYSSGAYLVKTDTNGTMLWNKTINGTGQYWAYSVAAAGDGYVITGNLHTMLNKPNDDVYLAKIILDASTASTSFVPQSSPSPVPSPSPSPALTTLAFLIVAALVAMLKDKII